VGFSQCDGDNDGDDVLWPRAVVFLCHPNCRLFVQWWWWWRYSICLFTDDENILWESLFHHQNGSII